jgi:hypothetical protein
LEEHIKDFITGKTFPFYPKDLLINRYRRENKLKEFIAEPSIFQHIGVFSSLGYRHLPDIKKFQYGPFESYSFEDNLKPFVFNPDFWMQVI